MKPFTSDQYQFLADIVAKGETKEVGQSLADIVASALSIAALVCKEGVIEATLPTEAALRDYCGCTDCRRTVAAAIRSRCVGADQVFRPHRIRLRSS